MIWLVIILMLTIAAYTAAVCVKQKGVPASISATFYRLAHPYWFMASMWLTAGLLMPAILEASKPGTEFLAFLACAGVLLVGAAPRFKEETERKMHVAGAVLCTAGSQVWVAANSPWCLVLWAACIAVIVAGMRRGMTFMGTNPLFWAEVSYLAATYLCLFIVM